MKICILALSSVLALGVAAPASAATWERPDPRGDVTVERIVDDGSKCGGVEELDGSAQTHTDITGLRVGHGRDAVQITVRFADLLPRREIQLQVPMLMPGHDAEVDVSVARDGRKWVSLTRDGRAAEEAAQEEAMAAGECYYVVSSTVLRCGTTARVSRVDDTVTVRIPRRCLGNPRWVRVGAETSEVRLIGDGKQYEFRHDTWGDPPTRWASAYGAAVRPR